MAANFWTSTHGMHWLLSRQALAECRKVDLQYVKEQELIKVNIWFAQIITELGRKLSVRQVIIATAITYFKRFYTKNSFRNTEPNLVAATCMYLACKIEESPHHIKTVIAEMKGIINGGSFPYDNQKVAEMEFYLLEELDFNMIVFHPYRSLMTLAQDLGTKNEDVQWAWYIINDSYRIDLCLLYPPHVIAAAALYLQIALKGGAQYGDYSLTSTTSNASNSGAAGGVTTRGARRGASNNAGNVNETPKVKDIRLWFAQLNVDSEQIIDIVQEIISLYELWNEYSEEVKSNGFHELLSRLLNR
ncbi:3181_t:CDS:2 [Funneliformis geosporum]|uniref:16658_t:CDS:1 n=1 Tax=Funneliformis geosporum TaxID=1117311 RepID=A0A9W4SUM5_9GLOM|nr:3181_t:CDS:2 [Funneliformis geosporum]CAI2182082.1 16658_t:CDS:2 [Funneliformis geosporum]